MGNIKIKGEDGKWKVVSSSKATGISVNDPSIQKKVGEPTSVEDVLIDHEKAVEKLKRNVSWLAKNGGGGGGGSISGPSGPSISEATTRITVNNKETGDTVLLDEKGLTIIFNEMSVQATKAWQVNVSINNKVINTGVVSFTNNIMRIDTNLISPNLNNHAGVLTISASYEDDVNSVYGNAIWNGNILEAIVNLDANDVSINLDDNGHPVEEKTLIYQYSTGIIGEYDLIIKAILNGTTVNVITNTINIINTETSNYSLNINELIPNPSPGSYSIEASFINKENNQINKTCITSINYISKNLIIVTNIMSDNQEAPIEVPISGSINLNWYCVGQGVTGFNYDYTTNGISIKSNSSGTIGSVINDFIPLNNQSWASVGTVVPINIKVYAGDRITNKIFYFKVTEAIGDFIKHRDDTIAHTILDFKAKNFNNNINDFTLVNNNYTINGQKTPITGNLISVNSSNLTGIKSTITTPPYLRYSNGTYGKIENFTYGTSVRTLHQLLDSQDYRFSMNICFKADYHPDNERTIFSVANVDVNNGNPTNAIEIDVHNVYINGKSVLTLTDNTLNDISITFTRITNPYTDNEGNVTTTPRWVCKVYLEGVLSAIEIFNTKPIFANNIYLAGKKYSNDEFEGDWLCDCNIYSFSLYDKTLNDEDVLINTINNKVLNSYIDGSFNFNIINEELRKSFCELSTDGTLINRIYDRTSDSYNLNMILNAQQRLDQDALNQYASVLGIPIVLIDVSTIDAWTFDNFILQQSAGNVSLDPATGQVVQYYDPNGTNSQVLTINNCTIGLQGTSTLADAVKNINISLPATAEDTTVFIPKETWFPEQTYTLKADVVDSSHSNNASIGKFINEVINEFFPYSPDAQDNVINSDYVKRQQPTATVKHTVEGFPVLLLMKFHVNKVGDVAITPLGIYNFNLGRDAYRNLGFKKVNSIYDKYGSLINVTTFPFLEENTRVNESDSNANWIEVKDTYSVKDLSNIVDNEVPAEFDTSSGDFWQNDNNILNLLYEVRYGSKPNPSDYQNFKDFVSFIMQLPIEAPFKVIDRIGTKNVSEISGDYDAYTYINGGYVTTGRKHSMILDPNVMPDVPFNPIGFYRYFVIANMFGLADNFGKNSTYRSWNNGIYYIGFYDMDTALGGDNQGELTINPDMWNKFFMNNIISSKKHGWLCESYTDNENNELVLGGGGISARANKIWLSIDTNAARTKFDLNEGGIPVAPIQSQYSYQYELLRKDLHAKAIAKGYTNIVEYFIKEYYSKQCGNCGPLLFNLDYRLKYLLQFANNNYDNVSFASKLHGRKSAYTEAWLNNRITFLDSWFATKRSTQQYGVPNDYESSGDIKTYNTPESIPVKFNTPVIINFKVGDATKSYYYVPANTKIYVDAGNNNSGSVLTGAINNSPQLLQIGDDEQPLSVMNINLMSNSRNNNELNEQGYPCFTTLDLSNSNKLSASFTLESFKPQGLGVSELRVIDLSNAQCVDPNGSFDLILYDELDGGRQNSKFEKLRKINIFNSKCVSNILIPAIPLRELNIVNSKLLKLQLKNQNYLSYVDITGCNVMNTIQIHDCEKYDHFTISNQSNIEEISLFNLPNLKYVNIINCNNLKRIAIQNCDSCTSIIINNCKSLTGTNDSNNYISIISNNALKTLDFYNCVNLQRFYISDSNQANINTLNIRNTQINRISGDEAIETYNNEYYLDLRKFTSLNTFRCTNNTGVINIQFANDINNPITLSYSFQRCSNLKRIFGHVRFNGNSDNLDGDGIFKNCSNFSIHGDSANKLGPTSWKGVTIRETNNRIKTPWEIISGIADENADENSYENITFANSFITGNNVTNISLNVNLNMNYIFYNTKLTQFDIYYMMFIYALQHTGNSNLYYSFAYIKNNNINSYPIFMWGNNSNNQYVDNAPKRFTFYKCNTITAFERTFEGSAGNTYIISPTMTTDSEGNEIVSKDNGLFSPLTGLTRIFANFNMIGSRFMFRRKSDNYNINYISDNNFYVLPDDTCRIYSNYINNINNNTYKQNMGNFTNFFVNLTKLATIARTLTNQHINFNTLKFPSSISYLHKCFWGPATGTCDLSVIFNGTNPNTLGNIFRVSTDNNFGTQATMPLTTNTLSEFTNLVNLGDTNKEYDTQMGVFGFTGMRKYIDQNEFPYTIFHNNTKLQVCAGFFYNIEYKDLGEVKLPNNMFENCPNLINLQSCFWNFRIPYTLTSGGFSKCTNLQNVYSLFRYDITRTDRPVLSGSIPYKLLFHGESNVTRTIKGVTLEDYNTLVTECTYDLNAGKTDEEGNSLPPNNIVDFTRAESINKINTKLKTYNNTYKSPRNTIENISYIFNGNVNIERYINNDGEKEINPEYIGNEIKKIWNANTKQFIDATDEQQVQYIDWAYDGNPNNKQDNIWYYDREEVEVFNKQSLDASKIYLEYIAPGDLLRYCTNNTSLIGLFRYCGIDHNYNGIQSSGDSYYEFGITGRICPYMFKPVPNITNVSQVFKFCRRLSSYKIGDNIYQIPTDLFTYCPKVTTLTECFEGLAFENGITLNVFASLQGNLDVRKIFAFCIYNSGASVTTITGTFSNNNIAYATGAFSTNDLILNNSNYYTATIRELWWIGTTNYVIFSNNFNANKLLNKSNASYVYYSRTYGTEATDNAIANNNNNYSN